MPRKNAPSAAVAKQSLTDRIDKLFEQGDPLLAAAMLSVGIASSMGVRPPMTRLLMTTSGASSSDVDNILLAAASFAGGLGPGLLVSGWLLGKGDAQSYSEPGAKEATAAFFLGMGETYLMSKLFSNPEFFKMLGSAASSGAGMLKGLAATAL